MSQAKPQPTSRVLFHTICRAGSRRGEGVGEGSRVSDLVPASASHPLPPWEASGRCPPCSPAASHALPPAVLHTCVKCQVASLRGRKGKRECG